MIIGRCRAVIVARGASPFGNAQADVAAQAEENVRALELGPLSSSELREIETILKRW